MKPNLDGPAVAHLPQNSSTILLRKGCRPGTNRAFPKESSLAWGARRWASRPEVGHEAPWESRDAPSCSPQALSGTARKVLKSTAASSQDHHCPA